jgi:ClpX C4-type zinc finger
MNYCSFCGNSDEDAAVTTLVTSDGANICDLCVDIAVLACSKVRAARAQIATTRAVVDDYERKAWEGTGP